MEGLIGDIRYALRQLAKSPLFTGIVVLTLALGIGANAAIFSLMDQILFRELPVQEPERLVVLSAPGPNQGSRHQHSEVVDPISHPMFEDFRAQAKVFKGVLAYFPTSVHLSVGGDTERAEAALVSGSYFDVLGVKPAVGRLLTTDDDKSRGGHPVVVLSHGYWQRRFASDPGVIGKSVLVNGHPMTVLGVSARGFQGVEIGNAVDLFVPLMMHEQVIPIWKALGERRVMWLTAMARLADGVPIDEAKAGINVLYKQILADELATMTTKSESFRQRFVQKTLEVMPGARGPSDLRGRSETTFFVLMGMVGLVLLIACANVANLLLARASTRQREVAVRLALGARRSVLVRQFLVESLLLSLLGGAAGLLVSSWAGSLILRALPDENTARTLAAEPDLRVAAFALGVALVTGLLFGLLPALQTTRPELFGALRTEAGSVLGAAGPLRFRKALVVAQVALSLLLLIGAGLFTRSLHNLLSLNPGFQPESLLAFSVNPSLGGYDDSHRIALLGRILDDVVSEPGVSSASIAEVALMTNSDSSSTVKVEGYESKDGENMNPNFNSVAPGFFKTLGIPLLAGRDFGDADAAGAPKVAIVNEAFVRYFYKGKVDDAVGRVFRLGRHEDQPITIVGVARDGKAASLKEETVRFVYQPYAQVTDLGDMTYYVRTAADVEALPARIRAIVRGADAGLPVTDMKTMRAQIGESLFVERMIAALSAAFGLLATALAALGLYGVMSFAVTRRTREIGIRMALGAERRKVLALVMTEVAMLAGLGVAIGLPSAWAVARAIRAQLFGLSPTDPLTISLATLTLVAVSLLAGFVPAHRASRVDPMVALRYE